jgi:hypothetical protein
MEAVEQTEFRASCSAERAGKEAPRGLGFTLRRVVARVGVGMAPTRSHGGARGRQQWRRVFRQREGWG